MPTPLLLALIGVFGLVAVVATSMASWAMARSSPGQRRLRDTARSQRTAPTAQTVQLVEKPTAQVDRLSRVLPTKSPQELSRLRRRLTRAGYRDLRAVVIYRVSEVASPLIFGLSALLIRGPYSSGVWLIVGFAVVIGFFVPGFVLDYKIAQRKKRVQNGLPDALDLIIVCVEAGASLDAGIAKARDELQISHPDIADELRVVTLEMQAGMPRIEALRNFATRTKVEDVRSLVAILAQTERFGTNVAQALRTQADTSRTKRRQRAEEKAAKIGVKLVFPLVFCLFPALYVVMLGPAVMQYFTIVRGAGGL